MGQDKKIEGAGMLKPLKGRYTAFQIVQPGGGAVRLPSSLNDKAVALLDGKKSLQISFSVGRIAVLEKDKILRTTTIIGIEPHSTS